MGPQVKFAQSAGLNGGGQLIKKGEKKSKRNG